MGTFARTVWFQGFPEELTSDRGSEAGVWQGALQAEGTETGQAPRVREAQQALSTQQGRGHSVWGGGPSGARDMADREQRWSGMRVKVELENIPEPLTILRL